MATDEKIHVNNVDIEGIVTKVWDRDGDVFARLAIYNENAEILETPRRRWIFPNDRRIM
jgi:hypothetical protein